MSNEENRNAKEPGEADDLTRSEIDTEGGEESGGQGKSIRDQLSEATKTIDALKDQVLRKAAEFENFKRRSETERLEFVRYANERLLTSLLPILDDLHRSLKAGADSHDFESFFRGVELISSKFTRMLEAQGLVAFESAGKPFDVDFHDALMQVQRTDVPPHTVVEEVERGYMLHDKVFRHAKVVVSASPDTHGGTTGEAE
jgi:molecular chaperone GrpE